jgi:hypothetical protein
MIASFSQNKNLSVLCIIIILIFSNCAKGNDILGIDNLLGTLQHTKHHVYQEFFVVRQDSKPFEENWPKY